MCWGEGIESRQHSHINKSCPHPIRVSKEETLSSGGVSVGYFLETRSTWKFLTLGLHFPCIVPADWNLLVNYRQPMITWIGLYLRNWVVTLTQDLCSNPGLRDIQLSGITRSVKSFGLACKGNLRQDSNCKESGPGTTVQRINPCFACIRIPYGYWFLSWLFHFPSSYLLAT